MQLKTCVFDLDGVVWLGETPVPGAADAIEKLSQAGVSVGFVTNMSYRTIVEQEEKLQNIGIDAKGKVITSATSAASLIKEGEKVLVSGGTGIIEAVQNAGAEVVEKDTDNPDAVIVGLKPDFNVQDCTLAMRAVRKGARLIGTNHDPTYPTPEGLLPGGGAQLASIATAAETEPLIAGKPSKIMGKCVEGLLGKVDLVIGDRIDSDGLFAETLKADFGLVFSGVTEPNEIPDSFKPKYQGADVSEIIDEIFKD